MLKYRKHIQLPPDARILVVKLATIGDLLLATPALHTLRETYPQARIDLLVTPTSAGLLDDWDVIDNIIVLDKYLFDDPQQLLKNPRNLQRLRPLLHALRDGRYDAVLLMHHLTLFYGRLKHQILMRATGAKWRIGLDNGHGWFLNVRVKDRGFGAMHEADYNLTVAKAAGAAPSNRYLIVPINEVERQQALQLLHGTTPMPANAFSKAQIHDSKQDSEHIQTQVTKGPLIAIHPGSGSYSTARRWSPERFAQLADTLFNDTGGQLILLGGPEEAKLHQQIFELMQSAMPVRSFAGKGTIRVAAAILEQSDLFIGNDSGLMHLATAVGTPTVAIFGLTNADAWGPYTGDHPSRKAVVVKLDLPCMPCFYRGHDLGTPEGCITRDCLTLLEVDPVATAARRLLRQSVKRTVLSEKQSKGNLHIT